MIKPFKTKEVVLDDMISLLKPYRENFVTFCHQKLGTLVIYNPEIQRIFKQIKVLNISDYSFRNDEKYLYTNDDPYIWIYQIEENSHFLLHVMLNKPLGFQMNYILSYCCLDNHNHYWGLYLIKLNGDQKSLDYTGMNRKEDKLSILDKFYLLIGPQSKDNLTYHYYVMINNRPSIKYIILYRTLITGKYYFKYSNYYLTEVLQDSHFINVMVKQQKNCKIIRKIKLEDGSPNNLFYNKSKVLLYIHFDKNEIQVINLWNLQKHTLKIDPFKNYDQIILTKNGNTLVGSQKNTLKIIKINYR